MLSLWSVRGVRRRRSQGLLDVSRQSVSEWVSAQRLGGDGALAAGKRGRRPGEKTALTPSQQAQIARAMGRRTLTSCGFLGFCGPERWCVSS